MDIESFVSGTARMSVFVSLLLAFFLLRVKTKNKLANRLFACYLLFLAIDNSGIFIADSFIEDHFNLEFFRWTTCTFMLPVYYLYVMSVCFADFRLKTKHFLHGLPFVIINLFYFYRLYFLNDVEQGLFYVHRGQSPEMFCLFIVLGLQIIFYSIAVFLVLKRYRKIYQENYTNPRASVFKWLFQISIMFFVLYYLSIAKNVIRYAEFDLLWVWSNIILQLMALWIMCWVVLKALNYPELFRGIDSKMELAKDLITKENEKVATIANRQEQGITDQIMALKHYMMEKEPFLDPSLTILELANQINIPVRDLSVLINHHIDQHFFDFVNEYRIKKAMNILKDDSKSQLTVLEILYEVGFNSKSSFNTSFKKYTNLTPTAYRNAL
jgi:AraC-like DNA-binding protein